MAFHQNRLLVSATAAIVIANRIEGRRVVARRTSNVFYTFYHKRDVLNKDFVELGPLVKKDDVS